MQRVAILVVTVTALMAGCLENAGNSRSSDTSTTSEAGMAPHEAFSISNNGTGCTRGLLVVFMEKGRAQALLPPRYVVADATEFFGQPAIGAGRAAALVSVMECERAEGQEPYAEASVGIFIHPPPLKELNASYTYVYDLGRLFRQGPMFDILVMTEWTRPGSWLDVSINASYEGGDSVRFVGHAGNKEVSDWITFSASGVNDSEPFIERTRWIHQGKLGIGFFEYDIRFEGHYALPNGFGGSRRCEVAYAPWGQDVVGGAACPPWSFVLTGPPFDFGGRFEWLPGLRA
jgi:hypothetical protein